MSGDPLSQAFFEEATELLATFEAGLLQLEQRPGDSELLNRIFRSAHTLKGNSAMLGFEDIARFTHALEDLLDQLRKGRRPVTPGVVDALLASEDALRMLLVCAQADRRPATPQEARAVQRVLDALRAQLDGAAAPALSPPPPPAERTLYEIRFRPPGDVLRRGLDPLAMIQELAGLGELLQVAAATDKLPPLRELDPERCYLAWTIWLLSARRREEVEACFDVVGAPGALTIDALPLTPAGAGPATVSPSRAEDATAARAQARAVAEGRRLIPAALAAETASIRVPVEKVDRLIDLVGELVITQSMVAQAVAAWSPDKLPRLAEAVAQMDRHARELHERMMAVRMLPIKTLFARFPRLVRDLAATGGKRAALEIRGGDTELDKTVIERIGDPLTHLVRNAVDHGLESPAERLAAGKAEVGRVGLDAYQQGGAIYIEVGDDGKGLDRERIVAKAVEGGLIGPEQVQSDEEAFALIFRPGLSTAERITEISGRGVGMDVVKREVEALGGSIAIRSTPAQGTTFRIKLPLTLAILEGQTLRVGGETYIVPLVSIVESVRPRREQVKAILGAGEAVALREEVLPMLRLHRLFGVANAIQDPAQGLLVIVEQEGHRVALLVDDLLGQQQIVIKSLETHFRRIEGLAGATILGDGRVALILDVSGLLALARTTPCHGGGALSGLAAAS